MFDLGQAANRVSNTFSALPTFSGPNMGQFNLGPINFNQPSLQPMGSPPPMLPSLMSHPSTLGPVNFSGFLGPINLNGLGNAFGGLKVNADGTNFTPPPPPPNQPNTGTTPAPVGSYNPQNVAAYIKNKAAQLHIDPDVALSVAQNEGLNTYVGDNGSSFGPFQLHLGNIAGGGNSVSGLGDTYKAQTGNDPSDQTTWKDQVDWVLNGVAGGKFDWSPFHGSSRAGIAPKQGIGTYNGPVPTYMDTTAPKTNWEQAAESQLTSITGKPYHWGGHDPTTGFDCSGFVSWVYGQQGVRLTPQTQAMYAETTPAQAPQPGDLVFFNMNTNDPHLQHVGIYMGNGQFINDTDYGGKSGVQVSNLSDWQNQNPEFRNVVGYPLQ